MIKICLFHLIQNLELWWLFGHRSFGGTFLNEMNENLIISNIFM